MLRSLSMIPFWKLKTWTKNISFVTFPLKNMYQTFLFIHSWLRWIVLILAFIVIVKSYIGWIGGGVYKKSDNIMSASFVGIILLQLFVGVSLYVFLSPTTDTAFNDFGAAMKDSTLRYWAVEHIFAMMVGTVLAQIGRSKSKKAETYQTKFKLQAIYYTIAILLILSRIPFGEAERLFRQ